MLHTESIVQKGGPGKSSHFEAISLLQTLIKEPSFSGSEKRTADLLQKYFEEKEMRVVRVNNNVCVFNKHFNKLKDTVLLASHHDTVKPDAGYTIDPYDPVIKDGKLFGLGSNDAGAALVSLVSTFLHFYNREDLEYNLLFVASAEEETAGRNGIQKVLARFKDIAFALVGAPTDMDMAIAERGLLVLDCVNYGKSAHVAQEGGDNAIYHALKDIHWLQNHPFIRKSDLLGPVEINVTSIHTQNKQHNRLPSHCSFVVDIRLNEHYNPEEIVAGLQKHLQCEVQPRNMRLRSTLINTEHPLVKAGLQLKKKCVGSSYTSDKSLMPFPSLKMGPGSSSRSHAPDEFVYLEEIRLGIITYTRLLEKVLVKKIGPEN